MMRNLQVKGQALPRGVGAQRGFALIITITLMAFLVLLLITVGTFTRIETEVASYTQKQSIAREHAKMAMEIAIGELQRHAGRDDRVTVRADRFRRPGLLSDVGMPGSNHLHHPFWTAVWDPQSPGRAQAFLVSGNEFYDSSGPSPTMWSPVNGIMNPAIQPTNSGEPEEGFDFFVEANQPGAVSPQGSTIRLVGPGSTSEYVPTFDGATSEVHALSAYVYAPRIPIRVENYPGLPERSMSANRNRLPEQGHIIGHYAYWVGDEGVKANLSVAGDRYPNEEYENRTDAEGMQEYREDLDDSWEDAFLPLYWEDDYLRTISPTRYGFSFLNGMWERDPDGDYFQYFQNFDPYSPDLNDRHINPRLSAWQRVVARGQAEGEDSDGFIINPQRNDDPYGFIEGNGNNPGELKRLFHDTTAFSRGVQATTRPNGGLKVDLSRFNGSAWNSDHRGWAQAQAKSVLNQPQSASVPAQVETDAPAYPLGIIKPGLGTGGGATEVQPFASPVVTHLHLSGAVGPAGYNNSIMFQSLEAKIGLWNPYDVEMDFSNLPDDQRIEIRLSHPDSSEDDPEPLQMAFGAGLHWLEREDPADNGTSFFGGWLTEHYPTSEEPLDLDFFSRDDAGLNPIAFEIRASALNTRFRAGETHLFSSTGTMNDGRGVMTRGRNGSPWDLPGAGLDTTIVDNFLYQGRPYDELDFDLQGIRPALYFPNGRQIRVEVVVVREEGAEDVVIHTLLNEVVAVKAYGDLSNDGEIDLAEFVGPFGGLDDWPEVWRTEMDDGGLFVYPEWTVSSGSVSGAPLTFAFGVDSRPLPVEIDEPLDPNLRNMDYDGRGVADFYSHEIPDVLSWNSNENGYPIVLFQAGTGEYSNLTSSWVNTLQYQFSLEDAEFMTFYHILRNVEEDMSGIPDISGYNWIPPNGWVPLSSVGQLRVGTVPPNAGLFDTRFFSTALLPSSADNDWPFFHNPRMQLYVGNEGFSSDVLNRMQNNPDQAAAHVMTEGAFNVNSTSVKAWAALLNSFAEQDLLVFDPDNGGNVYRHNAAFPMPEDLLAGSFSRFTTAPGASFFGRRNMAAGRPERSIWRNGFRELKPLNLEYPHLAEDFDYEFWSAVNDPSSDGAPEEYSNAAMAMAEIIVDRIRHHGEPVFGTVADFIGSGILQHAIDQVRWHARNDPDETTEIGLNWYYDPGGAQWRRIPRSSPSYLTQDDLFATLGSVLTARSDTFIVRTYGDAHNPVTGEVEARAWLEAVVQRVPTPVNPGGTGVEPQNPSSDPFGRKFEVIQMRWLDPDEI